MRSHIWMVTWAAWMLSSCAISISTPAPPNSTPLFMTATLPSTRTPYASLTAVTTQTATTAAGTTTANCKDGAVLLQDVTIADGTNLAFGVKFTKTWQLRNTGTCPWNGYSIAFALGDRMGAPDSAPVAQTAPQSTVNVSMDLVAPSSDGAYAGFFELRNAAGKPLAIGAEKTFWVKITVGHVALATPQSATPAVPTITGTLTTPKGPLSCKYTVSPSYPGEIVNLINKARAGAGLAALTVDSRLTSAAQNHSIDMACFSLLSHTGTNGSSIQQRIAAAGYPSTYSLEMIYGGSGAYPQDAFNWWMNDAAHHAVIFDEQVKDVGAGFAYVVDSANGDYYTVDLGSQ